MITFHYTSKSPQNKLWGRAMLEGALQKNPLPLSERGGSEEESCTHQGMM